VRPEHLHGCSPCNLGCRLLIMSRENVSMMLGMFSANSEDLDDELTKQFR
jgi:hypothetical protein